MKKISTYFVLALILFGIIFLPLAQSAVNLDQENNKNEKNEPATIETPDLKKVDDALEKEREIPEELRIVSRILFGMDETISMSFFIMLIMFWIIILVILLETIKFIPSFEGSLAWIVAIIVNLIIGISGGFREIVYLYNSLFHFGFLKEWTTLSLIVGMICLILIGFLISTIIRYLRIFGEKEKTEQIGYKVGLRLSFTEKIVKLWMGNK